MVSILEWNGLFPKLSICLLKASGIVFYPDNGRRNPPESICLRQLLSYGKYHKGWAHWQPLRVGPVRPPSGSHLPWLEPFQPWGVWASSGTGTLVYFLHLLSGRAGEINGHIFQAVLRAGFIWASLGSCLPWARTFLEFVWVPESCQFFFTSSFSYHPCGFFMHPLQKRRREK